MLGKNGVRVNGKAVAPEEGGASGTRPLKSRDLLEVGDAAFHFLLPRSPADATPSRKRKAPAGSEGAASVLPPALKVPRFSDLAAPVAGPVAGGAAITASAQQAQLQALLRLQATQAAVAAAASGRPPSALLHIISPQAAIGVGLVHGLTRPMLLSPAAGAAVASAAAQLAQIQHGMLTAAQPAAHVATSSAAPCQPAGMESSATATAAINAAPLQAEATLAVPVASSEGPTPQDVEGLAE